MLKWTLGAYEFSVGVQRHQDTEAGQQGHDGSPTITDERQRHADHRLQSADHAGVDEYIHEEGERETARDEPGEGVLRLG